MFESFVIMVREGIEAALVIGIILVVLRRSGRPHLEKPVFIGLGLAILASIGAAIALNLLPLNEEAYEGTLYFVSAIFVASRMWWMRRKWKSLRTGIEKRVQQAMHAPQERSSREAWGLGAFAFLMVFREGAETVMFLSAVRLTTDAMLSFIGTLFGLVVAIVFAVMFVRGSLHVDLRRFFVITEWVLGIFVAQLLINGYHEFSEAGFLPATQKSMALIGPIVRNNSLFVLAIVAIPLLIWISGLKKSKPVTEAMAAAERRLALARARSERFYGYGAITTTVIVLAAVGVVYAHEAMPKKLPEPNMIQAQNGGVVLPISQIDDGTLHRFGFNVDGRTVRFLVLKTTDGKIRTALDVCEICGSFGYLQEGANLICLNCSAEINALSLGSRGGCNPIPLASEIMSNKVRVAIADLERAAHLFSPTTQTAQTEVDPICGMMVKINEAAAFESYQGRTYYFCRDRCRDAFRKQHHLAASK